MSLRRHARLPSECLGATPIVCQGCEEHTAVTYCVTCNERLCKSCSKSHVKYAGADHVIDGLGNESESIPKSGEVESEIIACKMHPEYQINFLCKDCRVFVCEHCNKSTKHSHHEVLPIEEDTRLVQGICIDSVKLLLDSIHKLDNIESNQSAFAEIESKIDTGVNDLKVAQFQLKRCIDAVCETSFSRLNEEKVKIQVKIKQNREKRLSLRGTMESNVSRLNYARQSSDTNEMVAQVIDAFSQAKDTEIFIIEAAREASKIGGLVLPNVEGIDNIQDMIKKALALKIHNAGRSTPDIQNNENTDALINAYEVPKIDRACLDLGEKLGSGEFGVVMKGVYHSDYLMPVAVRCIKQNEIPNAEAIIIDEAKLMVELQHKNIVHLVGVCIEKPDVIMLAMELAMGPLNKYLKAHKEMAITGALGLMYQVAEGMAFLESRRITHRNLAARNVLVIGPTLAKISDEYYTAESAGKWPLKWYAPECIYYFKFSSKSDVWSYGITLWEATSYGNRPYRGLKGQQILEQIEKGARLDKPDKCPYKVYEIMTKCWEFNADDRPSFKCLVEMLKPHKL